MSKYGTASPLTGVSGAGTMHDTGTYNTTFTTRGNPTTISGPGKTTSLTYNIFGEVIKAVTNGQTVEWNYTSANNFAAPTLITPNANANLQTTMNWNSLLQPTGSSTPNGNSSAATYDFLNRPATQTNGDGISAAIAYLDDVNQTLATSPVSKVRTYLDGLGRPIKVETLDPSSNAVKSTTDTEYDSCACSPAGKLKRQSLPYAPGGTVLWTTYVYDGLGRTLQVIQPHTSGTGSAGSTTYAYAGNKVTVTDPAARWKRYLQNALGNLVQVSEPNPAGGADYETYYTYNLRDQLTGVSMPRPNQVGGTYTQTRSFVYDLTTGWLTSATNPENGTTTYSYDFYGRLNYKQDARSQRIEYTYDANNRVTKLTPKDASGTIVTCDVVEYFYDLTQNTYGRLSATQWGSKDLNAQNQALCAKGLHREEYTYTNGGRATSKTLKLTRKFADISNEERTAQMSIAYQYSGTNLQSVTYPSTSTQAGPNQPVTTVAGAVYQYTYDSQGRPTGETRQDGSTATLVDQVTYNTFGALTQMRQTLANKTETRAYDSFQRMTSMTTFDGTAIAYNYSQTANDGKLVSQATSVSQGPLETVNYTYDALGRLSTAQTAGAGGWGMSWAYDGWGNRLQQNALKGSVPTMVTVTDPATNRIQSHTYDANGNTVNTPQQGAMTYDVQNRLKTVASDTHGYDPANKRIWKNDEYTFWGAAGERVGRYTAVKLVNDVGTHVFVFQKVQVDEYFAGRRLTSQDRLGSVGSYYPYGEAKSGSVSNADSFATYYRDSTGLDYADQRYYATGTGKFLSSDNYEHSAKARGPQSWNRYSYVTGDPVNFNDSKGEAECWVGHSSSDELGFFSMVTCRSDGGTEWGNMRVAIDRLPIPGSPNRDTPETREALTTLGVELDRKEWEFTQGVLINTANIIAKEGVTKVGCLDFLKKLDNSTGKLSSQAIMDRAKSLKFFNGLKAVPEQLGGGAYAWTPYDDPEHRIFWKPGVNGYRYGPSTDQPNWTLGAVLHELLHTFDFTDDQIGVALFGEKRQYTDDYTLKIGQECFP